jgi:CTP:molybdopterin cytidylyltransferase MocA
MPRPVVVVFHRPAATDAPPLTRLLATAREALLEHQRQLFLRAGADRVLVVTDRADSFGDRLAELARHLPRRRGVVVMGAGATPLLRARDARRLIGSARRHGHRVLTNNRYSSDVCAITDAGVLRGVPAMPTDNALPRWLEEHRGYRVLELSGRRRLGIDLDGPLDLALLRHDPRTPGSVRAVAEMAGITIPRADELARVLHDQRAELLVAGRTSAASLRWMERNSRCRIRAVVEERGLRAATELAQAGAPGDRSSTRPARPPASILGRALAASGPERLGALVATFADGAVVDSRVLLADRLGADESAWPDDEDRFASDLLRPDGIGDGWLAALTRGAVSAPVPVLLGGHTIVGPGLPLLVRAARSATA